MMRQSMTLVIVALAMAIGGCSSSSQADAVDTNVKVLASNVAVDNTKTTLSATTLQSAIEEVAPAKLSDSTMVGTWTVTNYPGNSSGIVTFSSNGTYSVTSGAFKVAGNYIEVPYTGTWKMIEGTLVELVISYPILYSGSNTGNDVGGTTEATSKYPSALVFSKNRIILKDGAFVSILKPTT
ncbi:hypothetical protein KP005_11945 [Geomonas nitrogeniifigens]|uniref:Lipocalin-like domain-containing protein n=1 Tax=Geomonas diazotrophica TaxID=2843197 RepID=A0ABX8JF36_9BACT|nr:hypothetical protein [Geomonas nitrogeniifigens]QWV96092.1 hypothetical protein KP005_11945 [Geomonas nitrogeniifigens]